MERNVVNFQWNQTDGLEQHLYLPSQRNLLVFQQLVLMNWKKLLKRILKVGGGGIINFSERGNESRKLLLDNSRNGNKNVRKKM